MYVDIFLQEYSFNLKLIHVSMTETSILERLSQGDKSAFSVLFSRYYKDMVVFASTFLDDIDEAEEVVQEIFVRIYENPPVVKISFKAYLITLVRNRSIDMLRKKNVRNVYEEFQLKYAIHSANETEEHVLFSDLQERLDIILNNLPDDLATVFRLSRFSGYKNQEIADQLGVSLRTVESKMSKAVKEVLSKFDM